MGNVSGDYASLLFRNVPTMCQSVGMPQCFPVRGAFPGSWWMFFLQCRKHTSLDFLFSFLAEVVWPLLGVIKQATYFYVTWNFSTVLYVCLREGSLLGGSSWGFFHFLSMKVIFLRPTVMPLEVNLWEVTWGCIDMKHTYASAVCSLAVTSAVEPH